MGAGGGLETGTQLVDYRNNQQETITLLSPVVHFTTVSGVVIHVLRYTCTLLKQVQVKVGKSPKEI